MYRNNLFDNKEFTYILDLKILGVFIQIRAKFNKFIEGVRDYYSSSVIIEPWSSPDIVIYCEWTESSPFLYRARPINTGTVLEGIFIQEAGEEPYAWASLNPPLPPMETNIFRNKFIGLHSAVVSWKNGLCALLIGHRESGKSTLSYELAKNNKAYFLSDENALIHCRTKLVEPFARPLHIWSKQADGKLSKSPIPITEVKGINLGSECLVTHLVFLNKIDESSVNVTSMSEYEAFKKLIPHNLDFGSETEESLISLMHLVKNTECIELTYAGFAQKDQAVQELIKIFNP